MKIGLLSDTHSIIDKRILKFFKNCDEIWHAGDIGNIKTLESLEKFKKTRAVYGNIDNHQPDRDRKLLLSKKEINQIKKKSCREEIFFNSYKIIC